VRNTNEDFSNMEDPDNKLILAVTELCQALRSDVSKMCEKMDADNKARYDAVADAVRKLKKDSDDPSNTMAERTAADSIGRGELAVLARAVSDLQRKVSRPMTAADRNSLADAQAKADAVLRTHGTQAEPPMAGETLVDYNIRLARKMQPHSAKWKGVELSIVAADSQAFENVLTEIRADALQAGLNPVGLKPFEHREITEVGPGGHRITRFVGNGSIFRQMSRPVRYVSYIGVRNTQHL
jgi:hypothetical protein